ncbi:hypothetical protein HJC23_001563 [Cyclotella cryptica]|uniref:Uncharacterized protein n=1 Tax=Cyclotella cryptica TaxID=29204 RepID=A0ABD3PWG7_9STRA|eukprot:CCRYP_010792-RA/>CCRYP_010792-RA protein AED:0.30 eAED:0.30 QI:0/-1/0/1/-1/1/1/0/317
MKPTEDPDDPQQYIAHVRRSLLETKLDLSNKQHIQTDIHQNVQEIRAILKTNAEIFHRCMSSAIISRDDKRRSAGLGRRGTTTYARIEIDEVHSQYHGNDKTVFVVYPTQSEKSFPTGVLSNIPSELEGILKPTTYREEPHSSYIDHEAYFHNCLVLHDDILAPFLVHLKEYLISVQICLGKIDEWIMEPNETLHFLETTFGNVPRLHVKKLGEQHRSKNTTMFLCHCPVGRHKDEDMCLKCKHTFRKHNIRMSPEFDGDVTCSYMCPHRQDYFHCNEVAAVVLKECSSCGRHETKFSLLNEIERSKLKKFLDYITS